MSAQKIFISYRREDCAGHAGRLCDRLDQAFGEESVFRDVEDIAAGEDFIDTLHAQIDQCEVLLALIGPRWLSAADAAGQRRLDHEHDWVRREIARGLARGIRVIPILLQGAPLPDPAALPDDLAPLTRRQAVELRDTQFERDADYLVSLLSPGQARLRRYRVAIIALLLALAGVGAYAAYLHRAVPDAASAADGRDEKTREIDEALATLKEQGHDFSTRDFLDAIQAGNERAVELFLQAGMDANASDPERYSPLLSAIDARRPAMVRMLLARDADTRGALASAVSREEEEIIEMLWAQPLSAEEIQHALDDAASLGRIDFVERLISKGADINGHQGEALRAAVANAQVEMVGWLLRHKAKIEVAVGEEPEWTLLHVAVANRSHEAGQEKADAMAALLIDAGADVNARATSPSRRYTTPLLVAIDAGHTAAARRLLARGADISVRVNSRSAESALELAAQRNQADVINALIERGASVQDRNAQGETALITASRHNATDVIATLIARDADLEARDEAGRTALFVAVEQRHAQAVTALLAARAQVDARNRAGLTPLLALASQRHVDQTMAADDAALIARQLRERGASLQATNRDGQNALDLAQAQGSTALVAVLKAP